MQRKIDEIKQDLVKLSLEEFARKYRVKPIKLKVGKELKSNDIIIKKTENGLEIIVKA